MDSLLTLPIDSLLGLLSRRGFEISAPQIIVGTISTVVVALCIFLHYEIMSWSSWVLPRIRIRRRARVLGLISAMLVAHVIEIWIFGLTYWLLDASPHLGQLNGTFEEGALDFIYFSATSFTTVGFGDIAPLGAIRILSGAESLAGLSLITWSASFAFLEMQRDWVEFRRPVK